MDLLLQMFRANLPRDIALDIDRKATEDELEEYLSRPSGKSIPLKEAIAQIKANLKFC